MRRTMTIRWVVGVFLTLMFGTVPRAHGQVKVVDIIPNDFSDETRHNSEPYIAVNPTNRNIIAVSVFMPTPAASPNGPLLVSFDGGTTWAWRNIIPSSPGAFFNTGDITIRFNTTGHQAVRRDPPRRRRRSADHPDQRHEPQHADDGAQHHRGRPTSPISPRGPPQDWTACGWRTTMPETTRGAPRWIRRSMRRPRPLRSRKFESMRARSSAGTTIRCGRLAQPMGAPTLRFTGAGARSPRLQRRRRGRPRQRRGTTVPPFQNLVDTVTMLSGQRVVASTPVSDTAGSDPTLGNDWWGGDLYLTVDPTMSSRVYISYSDSVAASPRTLHLRRSTTSGQTWDADMLTIPSAKNAAIAVNSEGKIAYLYQQLTGTGTSIRWETHLRRSANGTTWDDLLLSDFPAAGPSAPTGSRIIGDYLNMVAVGKDFYGTFTSFNDLVNANFPQGVTYLRNRTPIGDPSPRFLGNDGVTTVAPSIDPFFFFVSESARFKCRRASASGLSAPAASVMRR
jgi:hypothetical protein